MMIVVRYWSKFKIKIKIMRGKDNYGVPPGRRTVKVALVPGWLAASMVPPWASTMALEIARPRPVWQPLPVRDLSAR